MSRDPIPTAAVPAAVAGLDEPAAQKAARPQHDHPGGLLRRVVRVSEGHARLRPRRSSEDDMVEARGRRGGTV